MKCVASSFFVFDSKTNIHFFVLSYFFHAVCHGCFSKNTQMDNVLVKNIIQKDIRNSSCLSRRGNEETHKKSRKTNILYGFTHLCACPKQNLLDFKRSHVLSMFDPFYVFYYFLFCTFDSCFSFQYVFHTVRYPNIFTQRRYFVF